MLSRFVVVSSLVAFLGAAPLGALAAKKGSPAIAWQADYGQALEETREESRPLLVVLDNPSNEDERLDPALVSATSGAFPLDSYELCRVDVSTEYGKSVADVFHVTEFPHVAIIDKTGSVILRRVAGNLSADQWKATLARHETGVSKTGKTYAVSKPVVNDATAAAPASFATPVEYSAQPAAYAVPAEVYSAPQPYCPSCQLRNRGY
ncbi:MAG: hypothetical protein ACRCT8_17860 [Lacipirellulaceae bacterium]